MILRVYMTPTRGEELWAGILSIAQRAHYRSGALCAVCLLTAALVLFVLDFATHWWWPYLTVLGVGLLFYPVVAVQRELDVCSWSKSRDVQCTFGDDGVDVRIGQREVSIAWETITGYKETGNMFLILTAEETALAIYKRFLATEELTSLENLLKTKCNLKSRPQSIQKSTPTVTRSD